MAELDPDLIENAALRFVAGSTECDALKEFREGLRLLNQRYPARALIHFMRATAHEQDNPYFISYVGLTLGLAHRKWTEAEELCQTALKMRRNQPQLHLNLAQLYLRAGRKEEALEALVAGLQYTARDSRITRALQQLGVRRPPVFPFLGRGNPLNRCAGQLRHLTFRLLHVA